MNGVPDEAEAAQTGPKNKRYQSSGSVPDWRFLAGVDQGDGDCHRQWSRFLDTVLVIAG